MSEFTAGLLAGVFGTVGTFCALFGWAACRIGARADEAMQQGYEPWGKFEP